MISKALVAGTSQRKLEELVRCGAELTLVTPPYWRHDDGNNQVLERLYTTGYRIIETPLRWNGNYHLHYYPALAKVMDEVGRRWCISTKSPITRPPSMRCIWRSSRTPALFFAYQNIYSGYPPPFSQFEVQLPPCRGRDRRKS